MVQRLESTSAQLVMIQEHHMDEQKLAKISEQLKKQGWSAWFAPAIGTIGKGKKRGTSGGVGFAWRPSIDICRAPEDLVPGRLVATAMRTRSFGIIFVYSIYGVVGDIERTAAIWNVAYRHTLGCLSSLEATTTMSQVHLRRGGLGLVSSLRPASPHAELRTQAAVWTTLECTPYWSSLSRPRWTWTQRL